jgi:Ni2+-binding GTPase involved in maturation of urease and hydrogenase
MERDARALRSGPLVFTNCRTGEGLVEVVEWLESQFSRVAGQVSRAR